MCLCVCVCVCVFAFVCAHLRVCVCEFSFCVHVKVFAHSAVPASQLVDDKKFFIFTIALPLHYLEKLEIKMNIICFLPVIS